MCLRRARVGLAIMMSVPGPGGGPPTTGAHAAAQGRPRERGPGGRAGESQEQVEFEGNLGGWWRSGSSVAPMGEPCAKAGYTDCARKKAGSRCTWGLEPGGEGAVGPGQVGALAFLEERGGSEGMPANLGAGFCIRLRECSQTC